MTKAFLSQNFDTVFQYHFLINGETIGHRQTLVASTNTAPGPGRSAIAFIPVLDDFHKITEPDIIARIKHIYPLKK